MYSHEAIASHDTWQFAEAQSEAILTMVMFVLGYLAFHRCSAMDRKVAAAAPRRREADIEVHDTKKKGPFAEQLKSELDKAKYEQEKEHFIAVVESDQRKSSGHQAGRGFEEGLAAIPGEVRGEVAWALGLSGLGACAAANRSFRGQLWENVEVWQAFAGGHGHLTAQPGETSPKQERDAFRRAHFRTNGERLHQHGDDSRIPECMDEAALVVRGLMPADGAAPAEATCAVAVMALRAHDPADLTSAAAARQLLEAAHRRGDVISAAQLERLESAASCAVNSRELMDSAFEEHLAQVEAQVATALDHAAEGDPLSLSPFWWSEQPSEVAGTNERWIDSEQLAVILQREICTSLFCG